MGLNFPFTYRVNGTRATLLASVVISENQWFNGVFRLNGEAEANHQRVRGGYAQKCSRAFSWPHFGHLHSSAPVGAA